MKHLCFALLTALLLPSPASADDQLDRIKTNWQAWAKANKATKSTISVTRGGEIVMSDGLGIDAQTAMPFASLGKAITAACTAAAINDGLFAYTDTVGALLGGSVDIHTANADITVAQLLSHGSGIAPDQTQNAMKKWVGGTSPKHQAATKTALSRAVQNGKRNAYYYNNENYAILGHIIEVQTNGSYEPYCTQKTLAPNGVTSANLTTIHGPFAAWGGWAMSADDYNRFIVGNFGPNTALGADPTKFPSTALNPKVNYGMGTFWRKYRSGHNYWHFGLLCFGRKNSGGSYFAYYEGKISVVVTHNRCIDWDRMFALDKAMAGAVFNR